MHPINPQGAGKQPATQGNEQKAAAGDSISARKAQGAPSSSTGAKAKERPMTFVVLGLDNAGKTTVVNNVIGGESVSCGEAGCLVAD